MVGKVAGIVLLVALVILLVASIGRIITSYREKRKLDIVAIVGLAVVILVLVCVCLTLLGPVVGPTIDTLR
jgi:hypothetical protein